MNKEPAYVDISEKNFRIRPFNAFDGGYAMMFVTRKLLPLLKAAAGGEGEKDNKVLNQVLDTDIGEGKNLDVDGILSAIAPILNGIDRAEFTEFMTLCLSQVDMRFAAGYMPLYRNGIFADEEVGCSSGMCLRLCFEVLKPLVIDFFAENGLNLSQLFKAITSPSKQ